MVAAASVMSYDDGSQGTGAVNGMKQAAESRGDTFGPKPLPQTAIAVSWPAGAPSC